MTCKFRTDIYDLLMTCNGFNDPTTSSLGGDFFSLMKHLPGSWKKLILL